MAKYRKKPVVISAEQWWPGNEIEGVTVMSPKVHFSRDRTYCYVTVPGVRLPDCWMSVEKIPGPMTAAEAEHGTDRLLVPGTLEITKSDGEVYRRKLLPFMFFEVKSGDVEDIELNSDLAQDYWRVMEWPERVQTIKAYIETLEGNMEVAPGDWVITGVKGEKYPCKPDIFEATYEPVQGQEE